MTIYNHLQAEERAVILLELQRGSSIRLIAKTLNRSPSSISREISRNVQISHHYDVVQATRRYKVVRKQSVRHKKLATDSKLYDYVKECLVKNRWSPEQISGSLKKMNPQDPSKQVSSETIYAAIYAHPRNELKKLMVSSLRRSKSKRGKRGSATTSYNSLKIEEYQFIHNRPEEINERLLPGHWEGDLIVGAMNQSCIGTLVERQTGFTILCKTKSKSALDVRKGFEKQMKKLPGFLRQSMTYDRGAEMSQHTHMSKNLEMKIYFADLNSPWQRGSNENTNGLLRQFFPKGTELSSHSQADLNKVAFLLNTRPRKRFDYQTPQELIGNVIVNYINGCCT